MRGDPLAAGEDLTDLFAPALAPTAPSVSQLEQVTVSPDGPDIEAWTDGGCRGNPGPAGYGVYIRFNGDVHTLKGTLPNATNNEAEYAGLIACLDWCVTQQFRRLTVYSDSEVMVRQLQGRYGVTQSLRALYQQAGRLILQLGQTHAVLLVHVRREFNRNADRLATQAMDDAGSPREQRPRTARRADRLDA